MILQANIDFMWNTVVKPRIGVAPYAWDGSFDPNNVTVGTDCSGAVADELKALLYGPSMTWGREFWTGTFAGATPGQTGPFGGVACTSQLVCIASPDDAPADAAMIIAVLQNPDATQAHMICQVQGINIEMGGPSNSYVMGAQATDIHDPEFNQFFCVKGPVVINANGIDYSGGLPGGAAIKAAGYSFACRYLFDGSPTLPNKLLTAAEAADLQANGVDIVSNWESTADAALGGFNQGVADAQAANANHLAAGGPADRPLYFSVDFDEAEAQQPTINAYFQGVNSVIGVSRTGVYGGYWVIKRCLDAGVAAWAWQTQAWSGDPAGIPPTGPDGDYLDPRANILQRNSAGFVTINGVQCDVDVSLTDDYGQWGSTPGGNVTAPDYLRLSYEQLAGPIQADGYGHGWPQLGNRTLVDAVAALVPTQIPAVVPTPAPSPVVPAPSPGPSPLNPLTNPPMSYIHTITTILGGAVSVVTYAATSNIFSTPMAAALSSLGISLASLYNFLVKEQPHTS